MKKLLIILCIFLGLVAPLQAEITEKSTQFYTNNIVPDVQAQVIKRNTENTQQSIIEHKLIHYTQMDEQEFYIVYVKFKIETKVGDSTIFSLKNKNIINTIIVAQGLVFVVKDNHIENTLVLDPEVLEEISGFIEENFEFEI